MGEAGPGEEGEGEVVVEGVDMVVVVDMGAAVADMEGEEIMMTGMAAVMEVMVVGAEVEETWSPPCGPWTGPTMVLTSL